MYSDTTGAAVWVGPVVLDGFYLGRPQTFLAIPGSDFGLFLVLDRSSDGEARLGMEALSRPRRDGSFDTRFAMCQLPGGASRSLTSWT